MPVYPAAFRCLDLLNDNAYEQDEDNHQRMWSR